jgi:hypothetical protein
VSRERQFGLLNAKDVEPADEGEMRDLVVLAVDANFQGRRGGRSRHGEDGLKLMQTQAARRTNLEIVTIW